MEISRIVHDELLHKLDTPQYHHKQQIIQRATHPAGSSAVGTSKTVPVVIATESTALIPLSKDALIVDMAQVDAIFDAEEREAVLADAHLETWDIVRVESVAVLGLAVPIFLSTALEVVPGVILDMMTGFTDKDQSTQILAGFDLEGVFEGLLRNGMLAGFVTGVGTLCTQAFGGKHLMEMWLFAQAGLLGYVVTLPFVLLLPVVAPSILRALGQDPVIVTIAGRVLIASTVGYPIDVILSLMQCVLHAQNIVMPFVVTSLVAWTLTLTISYFLAFHTSLGYIAFAIANPLSSLLKVFMLTPVLLRNESFVQSWPGWRFDRALLLLPKVAKLGIGGYLMVTFQVLGTQLFTIFAGLLPHADIAITVNGIFESLLALFCLPGSVLGVAGAIRTGNSLGAGQARRAQIVSYIVLLSNLAISLSLALAMPFVGHSLAKLSTPDQTAVDAATRLINQLLPLLPLLSLLMAQLSIYRACGRQLLSAVISFVCSFVINVPLGALFSFTWGFDLVGLWYGNEVGLVLAVACGFGWLASSSWTKLAHEAKHNITQHDIATATAY